MAYWLLKSEPDVYSIDDLAQDRVTAWDGVRNYQARNNLRAMKKGDLAFFYHSNASPSAVAGVADIAKEAYPDKDPRWSLVDIRFVSRFETPVSLEDIKREKSLSEMVLVKNSRLSVQPVTSAQWERVLRMAKAGKK